MSKPYIKRLYDCRVEKARKQSKQKTKTLKTIIDYTNEVLRENGFKEIYNPKFSISKKPIEKTDYKQFVSKFGALKENDMIWMKFTKDNYLGVVAGSNDVNFSNNTVVGKIIIDLKKEWADDYVLIFPLVAIGKNRLKNKEIERRIGDRLINEKVPILDFYSHRFFCCKPANYI